MENQVFFVLLSSFFFFFPSPSISDQKVWMGFGLIPNAWLGVISLDCLGSCLVIHYP